MLILVISEEKKEVKAKIANINDSFAHDMIINGELILKKWLTEFNIC